MPMTKTLVKVRALVLDEKDNPVLELEFVDADVPTITGTPDDAKSFLKLWGKTVPARLSIGAEDETAPDAEHLKNARDDLAKLLVARDGEIETLKAEVARVDAANIELAKKAAIGPDHPVVQLARGHLTVIREKANVWAGATEKATERAKFAELIATAREGLAKLEELVPTPKKKANGAEATTAPAAA